MIDILRSSLIKVAYIKSVSTSYPAMQSRSKPFRPFKPFRLVLHQQWTLLESMTADLFMKLQSMPSRQ